MNTGTNIPLLCGIVGSTAYGLSHGSSDVDRIGVYAAPTLDFVRLRPLAGRDFSASQHVPSDITVHEVGQFCRLALGANPTATELLWLPDDLYEVRTALAYELIAIRSAFLSTGRVRGAYLEYARDQFRRLVMRGDGSFSADTRKRTAKHARHLARLIDQGRTLYATGELRVRLDNPQWYHDFGERVADGDVTEARELLRVAECDFDRVRSPLPERPDERAVESLLLLVRAHFLPETLRRRPSNQWWTGVV